MKILGLILLFAPPFFAQAIYRKPGNPNDEPFLPINPIYPYAPKVMKRLSDKETVSSYGSDFYAPGSDPKHSFAAGFAGYPEKSPFFLGNGGFPGAFPQNPEPSYAPFSSYSPYYGNNLFGLYSNPYVGNPYTPGYFNEAPNFYPDYYNHGYNHYHPYPPAPEFYGSRGPSNNKKLSLNGDFNRISMDTKKEKPVAADAKPKKTAETSSSDEQKKASSESGNQYVDGNNFISEKEKESMSGPQRSLASASNGGDQNMNFHLQMAQLPPPTYKVISVGGQPVEANYPLPESYTRAKLMEQIAAVQNLIKSLSRELPDRQMNDAQDFQGPTASSYLPQNGVKSGQKIPMAMQGKAEFYPEEENNPSSGNTNDGREYFQMQMPSLPGRTTDAHVYGNDERDLPSEEPAPSNRFISGDQGFDGEQQGGEKSPMEPESGMNEGERNVEQLFVQSPAVLAKNLALHRYQNLSYIPIPASGGMNSDDSQSPYIPPEKIKPVMEEIPEDLPSQSSTFRNVPYRSEQKYDRPSRIQVVGNSYRSQNAPQAFTYRRMNSHPLRRGSQQQPTSMTDLDDVDYGTNQGNKE